MVSRNFTKIFTTALILLTHQPVDSSHHKRDLLHFAYMIWEYTGQNPINFNNYGNFCGYGGGGQPVDPLDSCCQVHDLCYGYVQNNSDCSQSTISTLIIENYKYEVVNDKIICSKENGDCSQMACICDKNLSECLREFVHGYDEKNRKDFTDSIWDKIQNLVERKIVKI